MKTKKETKTTYQISYEYWQWNEEDESYTDGPFDVKEIEVDTVEEANHYIEEFNNLYPDSKKIKVQYDRKDPMFGIIDCKLITAKVHNYEKNGEKWQVEFDVFREVTELD